MTLYWVTIEGGRDPTTVIKWLTLDKNNVGAW
jgi:hypothetical protein